MHEYIIYIYTDSYIYMYTYIVIYIYIHLYIYIPGRQLHRGQGSGEGGRRQAPCCRSVQHTTARQHTSAFVSIQRRRRQEASTLESMCVEKLLIEMSKCSSCRAERSALLSATHVGVAAAEQSAVHCLALHTYADVCGRMLTYAPTHVC